MQVTPAVEKLTGRGVELVALGKGASGEKEGDDVVLQALFDISDGSAR